MRIPFLGILMLLGVLSSSTVTWGQEPLQIPGQAVIEEAQSSYIFVFDPEQVGPGDVPGLSKALAQDYGAGLRHIFTHALQGFSANISAEGAARLAENTPLIQYYEPNGVIWAVGKINTQGDGLEATAKGGAGGSTPTEPPQVIPYGITRIGGFQNVNGLNFNVWIIDSGIDLDHPDLNVGSGANFITRGKNSPDDGNGHGTHIAGTIAALDNDIDVVGVAAGAVVHPVRVLDDSNMGTIDGAVAGVDWVLANASPGDCANMSLSASGHWESLHTAILNAADSGIRFSISAGNNGSDANNVEPAHINHANVFTVSAIDSSDRFAYFSNWGNPPIDFAAPGVSILSTKKDGGVVYYSGTSMAAPHVCGVLTLVNTPGQDGNAIGDPDGNPDPIVHR
ncbi:MAG: S8 family serine peptidase [Nitrospinota bacterium]|nr:S8 family serine peptidase [Nitrospinota bacterium]